MKKSKGDQRGHNSGYISFTPDDLRVNAEQDHINTKAYEWLDRAMFTSSHIGSKDRKEGTVSIEDVYPVTAEETEQMRECLNEAERSAGNPDEPMFKERLSELRGIVDWSSRRHRRWQWVLIAGVLLTLAALWLMSSDAQSTIENRKEQLAQVEAWTEQDTTIIKDGITAVDYLERTERANIYKQYKLAKLAEFEIGSLRYADQYIQSADTASDRSVKKSLLKRSEESKESAQRYNKEFDQINAMKFDEIHDMALEEMKSYLRGSRSAARTITMWTLFFIILIPLYIFAERPYGYTITRTRLESKIMGGIQKFFIWLATFCFGTGLAMNFLPDTVVKWSDGSRTTENNSSNYVILVMKFLLMAIGVIIFCSISCFMMIYLTFQALRRNFNWRSAKSQIKLKLDNQA